MARILFVNDDVDLICVCKLLLESRGHDVEAVSGAEQALADVDDFAPEVIILDYDLGHSISGTELAYLFRRRHHVTIPIVMISAQEEAAPLARAATVNAFLLKPFAFDELAAVVDHLLRRAATAGK